MSNISKSFLIVSFLCLLFVCCNDNSKQENKKKENTQGLTLRIDSTEIVWHAYKTNDKMKVSGSFNEFSCDREDQLFSSVDSLINGLSFSINSSSSSSGDPIRDLSLKDHFFKYLTSNFEINGSFGSPMEDSIDVAFDIFGENKIIRFSYDTYIIPTCPYFDQVIELQGTINLEDQFNATIAYNALHEKCIDLHKGSDGISKTWKQVDVHIKALVIVCCKVFT